MITGPEIKPQDKPKSKLKKFSIKFGVVCGIIVTATSAFNGILDSIQKWNETFPKDEAIHETYASVSSNNEEDLIFEQRIYGDLPPGSRVGKTIEVPYDDYYEEAPQQEWNEPPAGFDITPGPAPAPAPFPMPSAEELADIEPSAGYEPENRSESNSEPSGSIMEAESDKPIVSIWYLGLLFGLLLWFISHKFGKKINSR